MKKFPLNQYVLFILVVLSLSYANNRVAFSRPGSIIRTPGSIEYENFNQYIVGFSTETINFSDANYASSAYFQGISKEGFIYGLSYTTPAFAADTLDTKTDKPSQIGFHVHKNIFNRNNIKDHVMA